jgi:hypothetical protein
MKDFKQTNLSNGEKTLNDYIDIRNGELFLKAPLQTDNFIKNKRGVRIEVAGLNAGQATIAGATSDTETTTIPGALTHTGNTAGFYNTSPLAKQTVTFNNTNGAIGGLTIGIAYSQAEIQALRDATEVLADDVRNLKAALVAIGLIN